MKRCLLCDGGINPLHVGNAAHVSWEKRALAFDELHPGGWPHGKGKGTKCSDAAVRLHEAARKRRAACSVQCSCG